MNQLKSFNVVLPSSYFESKFLYDYNGVSYTYFSFIIPNYTGLNIDD